MAPTHQRRHADALAGLIAAMIPMTPEMAE